MEKVEKVNYMAQGPSRAQTRGPRDSFGTGNSPGKKLLYRMFSVDLKFKKTLKKYSLCSDKRCLTCPNAGAEQLVTGKSIFCKTENVVYLLECGICNYCYIGQTSNCIKTRITGHRHDIKNKKNKNGNDIEIQHFQIHDFKKVNIYILEVVPKKEERLKIENLYMCKLKTVYPYGLNSEFGEVNIVNKENLCIFSKFGLNDNYRNYNKRGCRGKGRYKRKTNISEIIESINKEEIRNTDIHVIKTKIFCLKNKDIKWFIRSSLENYIFKNTIIKDIILDLFKYKIKDFNLIKASKLLQHPLENLIVCFRDNMFDNVNFKHILRKSKDLFPLRNIFNIRLTHSYDRNLKNLLCNYSYYSKNIHSIKEDDCHCFSEGYKDYINPTHGHIVTGDLSIVKDINLRAVMNLGSGFRLNFNYSNGKIFEYIEKDLDIFILRMSYKYCWPLEDFRNWKLKFMELFKKDFLFYRNYFNKK